MKGRKRQVSGTMEKVEIFSKNRTDLSYMVMEMENPASHEIKIST